MKGKELIVKKEESKVKYALHIIKELIISVVMLFLIACGFAMIYAFFLIIRG